MIVWHRLYTVRMPKAAVFIALLIAGSLSVIAYFALNKPARGPLAARLLSDVDPSTVDSVVVLPADGRAITLKAGRDGAEWMLVSSKTSEKFESRPWPASASRVRAAIRLLCELSVESPRDDVISAGSKSIGVRLSSSTLGPTATAFVQIAEGSVAGRTSIVRVGVGSVSAEASLAQAFGMSDTSLWCEPLVFSLSAQDWSRVEISGNDSSLVLSRVGRAWAIQKPVLAGADLAAVEKTLRSLGGVQVVRFVENAEEAVVRSFEAPTAVVTTEFERREQSGEKMLRRAVVQELRVGAPADVGGTTVLCLASAWSRDLDTNVRTALWGPAVVVVDAAPLAGLASDAGSYVSRVSLRAPVADVFRFSIGDASESGVKPREFSRVADGWRPLGAVTITPDEARNVQQFLSLVGDERASRVVLKPAEPWPKGARVQFKSSDGAVVQELWVGAAGSDADSGLVTFDGTVYRTYESKQISGLAAWVGGAGKK